MVPPVSTVQNSVMQEKTRQKDRERNKKGRQEVKQRRLEGEEIKGDERNQACRGRTVFFLSALCNLWHVATDEISAESGGAKQPVKKKNLYICNNLLRYRNCLVIYQWGKLTLLMFCWRQREQKVLVLSSQSKMPCSDGRTVMCRLAVLFQTRGRWPAKPPLWFSLCDHKALRAKLCSVNASCPSQWVRKHRWDRESTTSTKVVQV